MLAKKHNTHVLNVRMDIRDFASIVSAYKDTVAPSTAQGTFARMALEDMARILVESGKATNFADTADAVEYLKAEGLRQQSRSARAASELLNELSGASLRAVDALNARKAEHDVSAAEAAANEPTPAHAYTAQEILEMLENESEAPNAKNDI